ncbi:MAG: BrnT family toxin [Neisseriaceae bacterium]
MYFEWDESKNQANIKKHRLSFKTASIAFYDPKALYKFDRNVDGEIRQHVIGKIDNIILALVVYTKRTGKIRVISARKANRKEREQYHGK